MNTNKRHTNPLVMQSQVNIFDGMYAEQSDKFRLKICHGFKCTTAERPNLIDAPRTKEQEQKSSLDHRTYSNAQNPARLPQQLFSPPHQVPQRTSVSIAEQNSARPQEIDKFLSIATERPSNFKPLIQREDMAIYKRQADDSPIVLVRCDAIVHGNIELVFGLIADINKRGQWDVVFSRLKIVKVLNEHTDVMYSFLKSPPMVANRDFLQKRTIRRDIDGFDIVIAFVSHEDADCPPVKSTIRAQTIISGYAFKKIDEHTTKLVIVSQTDVKGLIPLWVINKCASKSPQDWIKRLEKAIKGAQ